MTKANIASNHIPNVSSIETALQFLCLILELQLKYTLNGGYREGFTSQ